MFEISACDDGYLRRLHIEVAGHAKDAAEQTYALAVDTTLSDFDTPISIYPPAESQPYVAPLEWDELTATVYNGGNVRTTPSMQGQVLDQINVYEAVELLARSADGAWYQITNMRGVTGWVHGSLLTVDPAVAAQVPLG